jgi:hypothetical protein
VRGDPAIETKPSVYITATPGGGYHGIRWARSFQTVHLIPKQTHLRKERKRMPSLTLYSNARATAVSILEYESEVILSVKL